MKIRILGFFLNITAFLAPHYGYFKRLNRDLGRRIAKEMGVSLPNWP